jgi:hypothetical protein
MTEGGAHVSGPTSPVSGYPRCAWAGRRSTAWTCPGGRTAVRAEGPRSRPRADRWTRSPPPPWWHCPSPATDAGRHPTPPTSVLSSPTLGRLDSSDSGVTP